MTNKEALEKVAPKKPLPPTDTFHADRCAKCHEEVVTENKFCPNCGQAIDWAEVEE